MVTLNDLPVLLTGDHVLVVFLPYIDIIVV